MSAAEVSEHRRQGGRLPAHDGLDTLVERRHARQGVRSAAGEDGSEDNGHGRARPEPRGSRRDEVALTISGRTTIAGELQNLRNRRAQEADTGRDGGLEKACRLLAIEAKGRTWGDRGHGGIPPGVLSLCPLGTLV